MNTHTRSYVAATIIRLGIAASLYTAAALAYGNRLEPSPLAVVAATTVVAFALWATRGWVQRAATRIALGSEAGSDEAVRELLRQMSRTVAVDDVLPRLAEAAGRAVGGPSARVRVFMSGGERWTQTWPPHTADVDGASVTVGVANSGTAVGEIEVHVDQSHTSAFDRRLLTDLAGPAGIALSTVRLTHDLRRQRTELAELARTLAASRDRLLTARRDEQRRLYLEVGERVIPHIRDALALADDSDLPGAARRTADALDALRLIARGIFPPSLDGSGFAAAIDGWLERADLYARIAVDETRAIDPAVQVCMYFCAVTALDALASAGADSLQVCLKIGDRALLTVSGIGAQPIPEATRTVIADRIDAHGGSITFAHNTISADVPLPEEP